MFTAGNRLKLTIFGSSHGPYIGGILDGLPAGVNIDMDYINKWLDRRRPGINSITTQRKESDRIEFISGLKEFYTDGSPLGFIFRNEDYINKHYDYIRDNPRPGHADITMYYKYGEYRNYEGGGFFSGRMTLPLVAAGSIAMHILKNINISIVSYIKSAGGFNIQNENISDEDYSYSFRTRMPDPDLDDKLYNKILEIIKDGDSLGGIIKTIAYNIPPGIGEPFFDSVEGTIAHLMFSIPGLKGIEFGAGFKLGSMSGSQANDTFYYDGDKIKTRTNNSGGILGGITNGMPLEFSVVMKPTSSIRKKQETVNLKTHQPSEIQVIGRHDPFITLRAVPVVQALTGFAILDLIMSDSSQKKGDIFNRGDGN
ncbi:chorismate synthase [Acidiplasma aeolicum]|uniref:Chorismate synthase n=1 Tax=Acidiplasma aeolicum TaxID=507754 RepID=A0A0P9D176_9ARCH|nr:chorismate synthase [Acidiplasma aeolicum]KPV46031.1 chorismate synthase [Acidiplasma aeolicum]